MFCYFAGFFVFGGKSLFVAIPFAVLLYLVLLTYCNEKSSDAGIIYGSDFPTNELYFPPGY